MVAVARETKRVTQVGLNRRSSPGYQAAAKLVREGGIGKVAVAKGFHYRNEMPYGIGNPPNKKPPNEWEWDHWLGPAPMQPYNRNKTYYNFRWFYNLSGGQLTNCGVHYMDMLRWAIGLNAPRSVTAIGGKYAVPDNREVPDTLEVLWEFEGGHLFNFSQCDFNSAPAGIKNPIMMLRGTKGTMYIGWSHWEVVPELISDRLLFPRSPIDRAGERANRGIRRAVIKPQQRKTNLGTAYHARNFLDCIKSRKKCNCDVLTGHISTTNTLIGIIAHRTRMHLQWDAKNERFTNREEANKWLNYPYRPPYKLG